MKKKEKKAYFQGPIIQAIDPNKCLYELKSKLNHIYNKMNCVQTLVKFNIGDLKNPHFCGHTC